MKHTIFYFINFLYMEFIFHLYFWQDVRVSLLPGIAVIFCIAALQSFLQQFLKGKANQVFFLFFLIADYLLFASQLVYQSIFKQPLMLDAVLIAGGDALTNFWRETLEGILDAGLGLIALALGLVWIAIVNKIWKSKESVIGRKSAAIIMRLGGLVGSILVLAAGFMGMYHLDEEKYTEYQEFGYPEDVLELFGVTSFWVRDLDVLPLPEKDDIWVNAGVGEWKDPHTVTGSEVQADGESHQESILQESTETGGSAQESTETESVTTEPMYLPHILAADQGYLKEIGSDAVDKITDYVFAMEPTYENDYTGLFEGYNLIYITAEGFSTAAIDEKLTPTLYQLTHTGVVATEYYVPLWQTSTSDGEYVNLTGLIPDQQFSMKRTAENSQPFSLANYFKEEGAACYAYHNNTLSYYDRHLSHPNLGYTFKASKLGDLQEAEWGSSLFQMEHPNYWPSSDLEMFQATIPEYVNEERFHVYYMTISGHMNYNFKGNKMSSLHAEEVSHLPYSEEGQAYIACNMELDRALAYLIQELFAAGKLEETVICLSADHYPYAMNEDTYEGLMGMELTNSLNLYRNSLILWNSEMETVEVTKPCSAMDLMPTLLNLFGFEFDSRLYSGRDIFSDSAPLVVFSNRSFITDVASYNKKTGEVLSRTGEPVSDEYIDSMKSYVRMLYKHSAGILNNNYYAYFREAMQ